MRGGEQQSEWKRLQAAKILRQRVDSIFFCQPQASILIMGDLNGRANTAALKALEARNTNVRDFVNANIYNTGYYLLRARYGSYYYQGKWMTIDHLIVSGSLLNGSSALQVSPRLQVFRDAFLLEEDKKYFGWKPKRTYLGPRYVGGYSDHLPIYVDLKRE